MTEIQPAQKSVENDAGGWENEGGHLLYSDPLEALGITRTPTGRFSVGGRDYANLNDAIAQARQTGPVVP